MASSVDANYADLVQAVESGRKLQDLIDSLKGYFTVESIPEKDCWSQVECIYDESKILKEAREEFAKELVQSRKITNVVEAIISPPAKSLQLSRKIQLLVFQNGWSSLRDLVGKDDCIVLIPVVIAGSAEVTIQETKGERRMTVTIATNSEVIITGRCSIWIPPKTKAVCVVLCIAKDKG